MPVVAREDASEGCLEPVSTTGREEEEEEEDDKEEEKAEETERRKGLNFKEV